MTKVEEGGTSGVALVVEGESVKSRGDEGEEMCLETVDGPIFMAKYIYIEHR